MLPGAASDYGRAARLGQAAIGPVEVTSDRPGQPRPASGCHARGRDLVEARNAADQAIHTTEKALKDHGDKIGGEEKSAIEAALAELRTAKDGDDVAALQQKTQALLQASMKLGEAMYKAQQEKEAAEAKPEAPGAAGDGAGTKDEKVVDADYEEVDEKNKKKSA